MEYIPQSKAHQFEKGAVTSWEYDMKHATFNIAPISISGRYPESGYTSNRVSDSLVHVIGGRGLLVLKDGAFVELVTHDQVHLAVGEAYYFEGNLNIIYAASPSWTPQQTEHID